ncbi:MAG TPA: chromosome segregation ATPase, partial [Chroococcidiopsis sp.]
PRSWQFWAVLAVLLTSGVGVFALALLLKLPALPNCPSIFWPTASASLRLYCAQLAANKETVDDLLHAIELVDSLPDDHPLRPEINANIEQWSLAILELADKQFQQGKLDEAIQLARKIPTDTTAHQQVAEKIRQWRSIWADAEKIYNEAEAAMLAQDLRGAFAIATRLLDVGNTYWETTKYQELNLLITASREDGAKLARARRLVSRGGRSNLLEAIALAKEILPASPAYAVAQRRIGEVAENMLQLAERRIDAGNTDDAIALAREIPTEAGLQAQVQDLIALAMAVAQAGNGTMPDLEAAIIQVQRFNNSSRFYSKAQQLISRWQLEIQAVNRLDMARQMAQSGDVASLSAAIAEARQVPSGNPRYGDARDAIAEWTATIETIEDRPYLNQAQDLARPGDPTSLQAAINTARQIREGRALSGEAQRLIQSWTAQIQRSQDQPYLDEARRLAASGNIPAAIATAQQIQAGRSLYDTAQDEIRTWRAQTEGQTRLREAYDTASIGTAPMLLSAIRIADQVPRNNAARAEADRMINAWSQSMLDIAQSQAQVDLQGAIAIAASIPPRTEAYAAAQLRIQEWQQQTPTPSP